ncbi:MAG: hypothetical protein E3K37_08590 [Candidatus Kuenenia sp.]|nr:hypothetical protein [Candidatus Kuenenia hertensis]
MEKINAQIQEVKKAADTNSLESTLHAFVGVGRKNVYRLSQELPQMIETVRIELL